MTKRKKGNPERQRLVRLASWAPCGLQSDGVDEHVRGFGVTPAACPGSGFNGGLPVQGVAQPETPTIPKPFSEPFANCNRVRVYTLQQFQDMIQAVQSSPSQPRNLPESCSQVAGPIVEGSLPIGYIARL